MRVACQGFAGRGSEDMAGMAVNVKLLPFQAGNDIQFIDIVQDNRTSSFAVYAFRSSFTRLSSKRHLRGIDI